MSTLNILLEVNNPRHAHDIDVGAQLRAVRTMYGLSQRELAKRAGVTNAIISLIEQNRSSPSVGSLKKVLDGIPMSLAEFFALELAPRAAGVLPPATSSRTSATARSRLRQVGREPASASAVRSCTSVRAGGGHGREHAAPWAEEGGVVLRGRLEVTVGDQRRVLGPGDAYYFNSRLPHRFRNLGEEVCELVSACTPPSF